MSKVRLELRATTFTFPVAWHHVDNRADAPEFIVRGEHVYKLSTSRSECPHAGCQTCASASMLYLRVQGVVEFWSVDEPTS